MKLRIKDWDENQQYKKGKNFSNDQPWFKFHARKLLSDMSFMNLSVDERELLIMCWAIASRDNGFIPDLEQIAFDLRRPKETLEPIFKKLIEKHWFDHRDVPHDKPEVDTYKSDDSPKGGAFNSDGTPINFEQFASAVTQGVEDEDWDF